MNIKCECGGNEFEAVVPGRVRLLVNGRGQVQQGFAEVRDATLPTENNQYQCIACGRFATVEVLVVSNPFPITAKTYHDARKYGREWALSKEQTGELEDLLDSHFHRGIERGAGRS